MDQKIVERKIVVTQEPMQEPGMAPWERKIVVWLVAGLAAATAVLTGIGLFWRP